MTENRFYHALKVVEEACVGCVHCMNVCPTSAIRVFEGKAIINKDACIDCGMCLKSCPVEAIVVEQDDFSRIFKYKYRVALLPTVLIGQFPEEIREDQIFAALYQMGFTHVFEVDQAVDYLVKATKDYMQKEHQIKPFISAFCPAVIRLIQVKFPSLIDNIVRLKPVLDISALYIRKKFENDGINPEDAGIFYVTQCASKIASIKSPVGDYDVHVDGVINMDFIYNKILLLINNKKFTSEGEGTFSYLKAKNIHWTLSNGEASQFEGRCLAIDEIHNVIDVLEKIETEEISDVDYLELRACDHSCAGGVLAPNNRFLTIERLRKRAKYMRDYDSEDDNIGDDIFNYDEYLKENIGLDKIEPRSIMKLDENMMVALEKIEKVQRIMKILPEIDCGACGSPTCAQLAEDVVQGKAKLSRCVFMQKLMTTEGVLTPKESFDISENTWGKGRFDRKTDKN
jgi:Na+-translocating ferredoxin:NAD+ oxidoreductase RNF subunit RnfB